MTLLSNDDSDVKQKNNAILSSLNVSESGIDNIDIGNLDNFVKNVNPLDAFSILKSLRSKNIDKIVIAQLNINSLCNKFDQLVSIIQGNVDISRNVDFLEMMIPSYVNHNLSFHYLI